MTVMMTVIDRKLFDLPCRECVYLTLDVGRRWITDPRCYCLKRHVTSDMQADWHFEADKYDYRPANLCRDFTQRRYKNMSWASLRGTYHDEQLDLFSNDTVADG